MQHDAYASILVRARSSIINCLALACDPREIKALILRIFSSRADSSACNFMTTSSRQFSSLDLQTSRTSVPAAACVPLDFRRWVRWEDLKCNLSILFKRSLHKRLLLFCFLSSSRSTQNQALQVTPMPPPEWAPRLQIEFRKWLSDSNSNAECSEERIIWKRVPRYTGITLCRYLKSEKNRSVLLSIIFTVPWDFLSLPRWMSLFQMSGISAEAYFSDRNYTFAPVKLIPGWTDENDWKIIFRRGHAFSRHAQIEKSTQFSRSRK